MFHGYLIVNKERGMTSHQVVSDIRRIIGQPEVGHTGTLDPEATGVLVVGLGNATRSFSFLDETIKIYRAGIVFGQATDTQDATGRVVFENRATHLTLSSIKKCVAEFTGEISQVPPMFSAVKVAGRKLYELARQGVEIERAPRLIKVFNWQLIDPKPEYGFGERVECEITCSKGTYIRTLIDDLGKKTGCGAHMESLVRLRSGVFTLEHAHKLGEIREMFSQGRLEQIINSINLALSHLPAIRLGDEDIPKVKNGGKLSLAKYPYPGETARVLDGDANVIAVVKLVDAGTHSFWQPVKVFNY